MDSLIKDAKVSAGQAVFEAVFEGQAAGIQVDREETHLSDPPMSGDVPGNDFLVALGPQPRFADDRFVRAASHAWLDGAGAFFALIDSA